MRGHGELRSRQLPSLNHICSQRDQARHGCLVSALASEWFPQQTWMSVAARRSRDLWRSGFRRVCLFASAFRFCGADQLGATNPEPRSEPTSVPSLVRIITWQTLTTLWVATAACNCRACRAYAIAADPETHRNSQLLSGCMQRGPGLIR